MDWPRGSKWRKWDLHVHSPASENFAGEWDQFIIQLGNADCDVIGINDYFSVAGYKEVQRRLANSATDDDGEACREAYREAYREALKKLADKTLLPVVECRMTNVLANKRMKPGPRINFHLIFSPKLPADDIEMFIKSLKVEESSISSRYNDPSFLFETSVDFNAVCRELRNNGTFAGKFLIWIPYDEYGGIDNINPNSDGPFKKGLISKADILGSSNREQSDFFLWKNDKYSKSEYQEWYDRRKPCIKGSDSHSVNDKLGMLRDRDSNPVDKYCWIKADPTFDGLRQITNEPENRVYIGSSPPKMDAVRRNRTRYLKHIDICKTADATTDDIWFNCQIPLNFDMVAIIGNKGSGKSALADALALAGNTHCDPKYFSFLKKDRFCERNCQLAKQFKVRILWEDDTKTVTPLNAKPNERDVERVKYIPQTYLEKVCTEPGQVSEFQRELYKVIYSHISDAERLGKESLEELIKYKTEELTDQCDAYRQEISRLNTDLIRLETKDSADNFAQLQTKLKLKEQELAAHVAAKPVAVVKPENLTKESQKVYANALDKLEKERGILARLETKITQRRGQQKTLTERIAIAKKLEGKLDNFKTEFTHLKDECAAGFQKLELDFDEVITLKINKGPLMQRRGELAEEKTKVDAALSPSTDTSFLDQKTACAERIKSLQDKLDAPNKQYQAYKEAIKAWQEQKQSIEGDTGTSETLRYFESQLKFIQDELPQEINEVKEQRRLRCHELHKTTVKIRDVHEELFKPVQELIQGSVIIKEGFKLTFDSSIIERTFQHDFLETYINQGVAGSFCGKEKGSAVLEGLRANYDFSNAEDAVGFVEKIIKHLRCDMRTARPDKMEISSQLRKHTDLKQFYDYLWSFSYLRPEYSLKLDGKNLTRLSPGERGTLLLIFYLLLDLSNWPIIVDQPEENLDSQTVYRLLIPVIKKVKKRRQIIMVTHSPNIAVVCDAEQVIHASIDRANKNQVVYTTGSIESPQINKHLINVLEGTRPAFENRELKYYKD